ncbi:hypothetical protein KR093_000787 [Drosophila rubida]|uniref:Protein swallow n=1 Tax=Drosophila rubida TaxID=30044 RepID=A0AAD4PQ61_9MUSC|nr:hypothetical protein KR093_000787 [Drosophila rubida]
MSLMDESFPTDELFDELNNTRASLRRQYSICRNLPTTAETAAEGAANDNETPFLNSDCSEETCASDPVGLDHDRDERKNGECTWNACEDGQQQLGSGRSSKAVSYQDIHSAYTKRRYKHVTSKVAKYIADMNGKGSKGGQLGSSGHGSASGPFQRHRSMPECLTPRDDDQHQQQHQQQRDDEESMSVANSSDATNTAHTRDESYERLINEKDFLQSHNNFLEARLYKKIDENILLRKNIDVMRNELSEYKDKLKRQAANSNSIKFGHSLHSLVYNPVVNSETTATQTDLPPLSLSATTAHMTSQLSNLSDLPAIAANATPHPNTHPNLNDITYDSRDGSIEIPLLSVQPTTRRHLDPQHGNNSSNNNNNMKPLSLNFSDDSGDVDANGNAIIMRIGSNRNGHTTTTNNSGSSQPSSNDSAIEIVERSPQPPRFRGETITFGPAGNWSQRKTIICFDKHSNRVIDLIPLNAVEASSRQPAESVMVNSSNSSSQSFVFGQYTTNAFMRRPKKSLTSRILRLFGPCARCDDPNQTFDATNATYTVGIPLLNDDSSRV